MSRIWSALIPLVCVGVPVGLYLATAPASPHAVAPLAANLCFTAGAITYQVSPDAVADFRFKIDDARPDLRIALIDGVETADFAVVDGVGGFDTCESTGRTRTVHVVGAASDADVTMSLSRETADADFKLFVHSAHLRPSDVAALVAVIRLQQRSRQLAEVR